MPEQHNKYLESTIRWYSVKDCRPEDFLPVYAILNNRNSNRPITIVLMHDSRQWVMQLLIENQCKWIPLSDDWQVTHWAEIITPKLISNLITMQKEIKKIKQYAQKSREDN